MSKTEGHQPKLDCKECPFSGVHTRMDDAHRLWHQAMDSYFDSEAFRINVQNCIQTLRTVTWLFQKQKREVPNFEEWYGEWQKKMRADQTMKWLVDARNKIEKQGDLQSSSEIHAIVIASHTDDFPIMKVQTNLFETLQETLAKVPIYTLKNQIIENGALKVQRRWVDSNLPDQELLEALAYVYGQLSLLIDDAHKQLGLPISETVEVTHKGKTSFISFDKEGNLGRLPCMVANDEHRTLVLSLKTGEPLHFLTNRIMRDENEGKKALERYNTGPLIEKLHVAMDLKELARIYFDMARSVFLVDGYHLPFMVFVQNSKIFNSIGIGAIDKTTKYLLMRKMADEVKRTGADAVMFLTELWYAPLNKEKPYASLEESDDKVEHLGLFVCSKDGSDFTLLAEIMRNGDEVSLLDTIENMEGQSFIFEPIKQIWQES